jgi:hypothetical protein
MNQKPIERSSPEILANMALVCLAHMDQEEMLLAQTRECLRRVREALLHDDAAAVAEALARQNHLAQTSEQIGATRGQLLQSVAAALDVPLSGVTLQLLAARVPGELSERLAACRVRVQRLAKEVDELNRGNAALIGYSLQFVHQLLIALTGGEAIGDRYGPVGKVPSMGCGSVVSTQV